jgi:glycosyltransferase involved in cell wall biosynthesis
MKIALVAPGIWGSIHLEFARALVQLGHHVVVYTEDARAPSGHAFTRFVEDGIQFQVINDSRRSPLMWVPDRLFKHWLGRRFFTTLAAIRRFLAEHRDAGLTFVESDWIGLFVALAGIGKRRWVVGIHDTLYLRIALDYPGRPRSGWRERAKLWVLDRASVVRANSYVTRDALVEGGCDAAKIRVVPLQLPAWIRLPQAPLARFRRDSREQVRQRFGIAHDTPLAVVMCRLDPVKGIELSIEALARMTRPVRLLICGGDRRFPRLGSYHTHLRRLAETLGVAHAVIFAGELAKEEVARYLAAADVHLAPSLMDTFNYSVVEATLVGTPSVMSDKVGAGPWIVAAGAGAIVADRDAAKWAASIDAALGSPPSDETLQRAASKLAAELAPRPVAQQVLDAVAS